MPRSLLAATAAPTPEPQTRMPRSASPPRLAPPGLADGVEDDVLEREPGMVAGHRDFHPRLLLPPFSRARATVRRAFRAAGAFLFFELSALRLGRGPRGRRAARATAALVRP